VDVKRHLLVSFAIPTLVLFAILLGLQAFPGADPEGFVFAFVLLVGAPSLLLFVPGLLWGFRQSAPTLRRAGFVYPALLGGVTFVLNAAAEASLPDGLLGIPVWWHLFPGLLAALVGYLYVGLLSVLLRDADSPQASP